MKKKITLMFSLMATTIAFGQVGINTTTPQATLDVVGKKGIMDKDGLTAPRLTRAELTAKGNTLYNANQNGTIIYITDVSGGDTTSQRINITAPGYYYFDSTGNIWQKILNKDEATSLEPWQIAGTTSKATANNQNIYQNGRIGIFNSNPLLNLSIGQEGVTSNLTNQYLTTGFLISGNSPYLGWGIGGYYENVGAPSGLRVIKNEFSVANGDSFFGYVGVTDDGNGFRNSLFGTNLSTGNFSIGLLRGIGASEKLDVDGNARIRAIPDGDPTTHPYKIVAKTDGTLGKELDTNGSVQFTTGSFQNLDLTNTTRANLKDIYFFSHGATITLPKATNALVGVEITFYISGGAADSFTTGLTQEFSVSMPATDTTANLILNDSTNTSPYSNLISSWNNTKVTFVNNRSRIFRALNFKLVSNGQGIYRWMFWASGV